MKFLSLFPNHIFYFKSENDIWTWRDSFPIFNYWFVVFCYRDLSNNMVKQLVPGVFADLSWLQFL